NAYSASNIYANLEPSALPSPCPGPALGAFSNSAPFPGPTSAPFWQPDLADAASGSCAPVAFGWGGAQFLAAHLFSATLVTASAGVAVPTFIQATLGQSTKTESAAESFVHAATPGVIMYCSTEVRDRVNGAITASGSSVPPTPIPVGSTPTPSPPDNNGVCQ
ncbi:MAG TPA: hypothetical protein VNG31_10110, partial [Candidatus Baltobacteraceae bacterium]|nr:hypothetical protein [Candidatus Baltobacteraceae bacterium]